MRKEMLRGLRPYAIIIPPISSVCNREVQNNEKSISHYRRGGTRRQRAVHAAEGAWRGDARAVHAGRGHHSRAAAGRGSILRRRDAARDDARFLHPARRHAGGAAALRRRRGDRRQALPARREGQRGRHTQRYGARKGVRREQDRICLLRPFHARSPQKYDQDGDRRL